jgi:hypothetical protein
MNNHVSQCHQKLTKPNNHFVFLLEPWILQLFILLWMMHKKSSFHLMDFAFQLGENHLWLLVLLMPFAFQFVFDVINNDFSNFGIQFFPRLLNYEFQKGWTFFFRHPHSHPHRNDVFFSINSQHIKRFDQYFSSLFIYSHTYMIMKIVITNFMQTLIFT